MITLEILSGIVGCFLLIWSLNLRRMSAAQRPRFSRHPRFRFGVPLLGGSLVLLGFGLAIRRSLLWGGLSCTVSLVLCWLLLQHDQYSAMMRILYDDYLHLKKQNPQSKEYDLLFSIVKSRYPRWSEDRMMEICVGKDIKQLVLLLLVIEYEIHPLNDMLLYEKLKAKVEELHPQTLDSRSG
jgi:hypothetical protein